MSGVFISYRREDASGHAGWLREGLAGRLGRDQVFMDIDTIEPGLDFVEVLQRAVDDADVFLVLIGNEWLTIEGPDGRRRLDNPEDYHRLEVEAALKRRIRVVPVLVQGATVPAANELPETLRTLARRNGFELSDSRWAFDLERLTTFVERDIKDESADRHGAQPPPPPHATPPEESPPQTPPPEAPPPHTPRPEVPPPREGEGQPGGGARKKLLRRSAIVLGACLAVLGVLVVIGLLIPGEVTREQAQRAAVDFALQRTPEGVELTASCGRSGDGWLCGIDSTTAACTDRDVGAVMVGSSGTAVKGDLACEPSDPKAGPDPFSDERKVEDLVQTLITDVHEQIVAGDYDAAWSLYSKRKRAQIERRDGFDRWRQAQEKDLKPYLLYPRRANVELQELDRDTREAIVRVTGMGWSKPGASCSSWSGVTWAKYEDGRWRYDPGYTTTPERESRWKARYNKLLGGAC